METERERERERERESSILFAGHTKDDHPTHPLSFKRKPGGLGPEPLGRRGRGTSSGGTLLSVEKKKK